MIVGVAKISLIHIECNSLKEKRSILNSLINKIRNNYPVSIAEVDKQDLWNTSVIGISLVSTDQTLIDSVFNKILTFIDSNPLVEVISKDFDFIHL